MDFTTWDIFRNLLFAARWTIGLTFIAFVGSGILGFVVLVLGISKNRWMRQAASAYITFVEGTPLLLQLFVVFFGLPLVGIRAEPMTVACFSLSLYGGAFLADIWRGGVRAVPAGQWDAAASLGLHRLLQLVLVVLPQAFRVTSAPTVGFLVQLLKNTAFASVIGFDEILKAANAMANATFEPFTIYGFVMTIYFTLCFPMTRYVSYLESKTMTH